MKLYNFNQFIGESDQGQYHARGTKFFYFGSHLVTIQILKGGLAGGAGGVIEVSKDANDPDLNKAYAAAVKKVEEELKTKGISGVVLPTVDQLEDSSKK